MSGESLAGRDLVTLLDFSTEELERILDVAAEVKANPRRFGDALTGKTLFMYFEKPSLRTRVTFEAGMTQLGGHAIYYTASDGKIGVRESVEDVARNLERWVDGAMCRTFSHELVSELARIARIPIINGLTDKTHPCQALADYLTLREVKGELRGKRLVYLGDGNNVAHSLMLGGARLGVSVGIITPEGYSPQADVVADAKKAAEATGATIEVTNDLAAVEGADARLHRRLGLDGPGGLRRRAEPRLQGLPGQRRADASRRQRGDLHALPAGPPGRRGDRRGGGFAAVGDLPGGREPAARPESAAAELPRRRLRPGRPRPGWRSGAPRCRG